MPSKMAGIDHDDNDHDNSTINIDIQSSYAETMATKEKNNGEEEGEDTATGYCTFAVTGDVPTFQPIFVCNECFLNESSPGNDNNNAPLCICQACADYCHDGDDHDVEYIGMGPCYCDCNHAGECKLLDKSLCEAKRLGAVADNFKSTVSSSSSDNDDSKNDDDNNENSEDISMENVDDNEINEVANEDDGDDNQEYIMDVYSIPILEKMMICNDLVQEATELIKYSKETFWLDTKIVNDMGITKLSPLERLAWLIYQTHLQQYKDILLMTPSSSSSSTTTTSAAANSSSSTTAAVRGGAEWWVQVKYMDDESNEEKMNNGNSNSNGKDRGSIDLHYDKDEALAESFGIGHFPKLSTVTYLTSSTINSSPTIVFDHIYEQGEDEVINSMLVSHPRLGKHLLFDGKLLHGAPSHKLLKPIQTAIVNDEDEDDGNDNHRHHHHHHRDNNHMPLSGFVSPSSSSSSSSEDITQQDQGPKQEQQEQEQHKQASLLDSNGTTTSNASTSTTTATSIRVTFLVNIWTERRPANVQVLDDTIRQKLSTLKCLQEQQRQEEYSSSFPTTTVNIDETTPLSSSSSLLASSSLSTFAMKKESISKITLQHENELPIQLRQRIELPFVPKGNVISWEEEGDDDDDDDDKEEDHNENDHDENENENSENICIVNDDDKNKNNNNNNHRDVDDDDDDGNNHDNVNNEYNENDATGEGGLVVITFPPPPPPSSTITSSSSSSSAGGGTSLIRFGPGLQAYLDYATESNDYMEQQQQQQQHHRHHHVHEIESGYC